MAKKTVESSQVLKGVSAAERALAVFTAFRRGDSALSLAELAERTGLVKSTIMRLALSLERYRLVARLPDGSYRLDAEALRLGPPTSRRSAWPTISCPVLEQLTAKTGETTSFYVRNGEERLCLFRVESASRIRIYVKNRATAAPWTKPPSLRHCVGTRRDLLGPMTNCRYSLPASRTTKLLGHARIRDRRFIGRGAGHLGSSKSAHRSAG